MCRLPPVPYTLLALTVCAPACFADEPPALEDAIRRSLTLIEKSSAESRRQRTCFTCHHQAMPVLTLTTAKDHGFAVDEQNLREQVEHTAAHLRRGRSAYKSGQGQGGRVDTAGYALATLAAAKYEPDDVTAVVADYVLGKDKTGWSHASNRPPSEASDFTTTAVAVLGLRTFATDEQQERVDDRLARVRDWLADTEGKETEDHVFRLHALRDAGGDPRVTARLVEVLKKLQRDDGGWAQKPNLDTDAYATGSVLVALHQAGGLPVTDPVYRRGVGYLRKTQLDDGSWHVRSRSKPFQTYFESGFPHGKDQFISIAGSCWATTALILAARPERERGTAAEQSTPPTPTLPPCGGGS